MGGGCRRGESGTGPSGGDMEWRIRIWGWRSCLLTTRTQGMCIGRLERQGGIDGHSTFEEHIDDRDYIGQMPVGMVQSSDIVPKCHHGAVRVCQAFSISWSIAISDRSEDRSKASVCDSWTVRQEPIIIWSWTVGNGTRTSGCLDRGATNS